MDSFMYEGYMGFSSGSTSLRGRSTAPLYPTRIYTLSKVIVTENVDNNIKWWQLRMFLTSWGVPNEPIYVEPQPGYMYLWNTMDKTFTVTDDLGESTVVNNITQMADFRISWQVIKSTQFYIKYLSAIDEEIVMIGERLPSDRAFYKEPSTNIMNQDFLVEGDQHIIFNRLVSRTAETSDETNSIDFLFSGMEADSSILVPKAYDLEALNSYSIDLVDTMKDICADRQEVIRQANLINNCSFMMIAFFANNLLNAHPKVLFEPWMLWQTWKWFYHSTHTSANSRQIFDLSPRW